MIYIGTTARGHPHAVTRVDKVLSRNPKMLSRDQHRSINQCYICSNEIHGEFMPAIHQKSLVWLILTFSTSQSKTTIQIAIDSNLDTRISISYALTQHLHPEPNCLATWSHI
jgi:hypothetical protein